MITSLIAGTAVPLWDRALLHAMNNAVIGLSPGLPERHMAVANLQGEIHRNVVADGPHEYMALLGCFAHRGFDMRISSDEVVVVVPTELVWLRSKSQYVWGGAGKVRFAED
jgi:hypothetical protein